MIKAAIMETNPFHNGHKYFLEQIPKKNDDILIVIVSTTIVQRGEISILNKHEKSRLLLDHNADIVIALPALFANQGGRHFAYHALRILSEFKIDALYFGSESNDLAFLQSQEFNVSKDFKNGIYNQGNENFQSNDILGVSYLRAIKDLNLNITPYPIKRIKNNYNDTVINTSQTIASATSIRNNLNQPQNIVNTMPSGVFEHIKTVNSLQLFGLFKNNLDFCLDYGFSIFLSENNQLLIHLKRILQNENIKSIEELVTKAANKNNSKYKYQRVIINTILLVNSEQYNPNYTFIHLLGFSASGQKYIKTLQNPLIVTSLKNKDCFVAQIEKRATNLYNIVTDQQKIHDYLPPVTKS